MLNKFFSIQSQKCVTMIEYLVATLIGFFGGNASIKSQKGVTMIEYALLAALVAVVAVATLTPLGVKVAALFTSIGTKLP